MKLSIFFNDIKKYISSYNNPQDTSVTKCNLGAVLNCPVFVVNLERSKYRRTFILNYLSSRGINAEIITAVEGIKLDLEELEKKGIYSDTASHDAFSRSLTLPEIGASLSHAQIYKKILDEDIEMAVVLEDDIMFRDGAEIVLKTVINEVPDDWDIIQLYYTCKDYEKIGDHVARFLSKKCIPVGAPGYMIRKSGAEKLLKELYPIRYPADSIIGRSPRWGTKVYGSVPQLVILNNLFPTEIHLQKSISEKIRYNTKQIILRVLACIFSK